MSIITSKAPCWELAHDEDAEWVAHYDTEAEALKDRDPDDTAKPTRRARACFQLVCNGCDQALGYEEMVEPAHGMHLDAADGPWWMETLGWWEDGEGRDWCPDCEPAEPVERDLSRVPGPDDVPLPGMEPS